MEKGPVGLLFAESGWGCRSKGRRLGVLKHLSFHSSRGQKFEIRTLAH